MSFSELTLKNKDGKDFTATLDVARDLIAVHHICLADIVPSLYGTSIQIDRERLGEGIYEFTMKTGDPRDGVYTWCEKV